MSEAITPSSALADGTAPATRGPHGQPVTAADIAAALEQHFG